MGISAISRLGLYIVVAAMAMSSAATNENVGAPATTLRIASLNLCTDTLLLQYADPEQIASVTWLSSDPNLSPFAAYARTFHRNQGRAEGILRRPIDLVLTGPTTSTATRAMLKRMEIATLHLDDANSIDALSRNIRRLTQAIGQTTRGDESLQLMYNTLAKLARGSKETAKDQWPYAAFIQPNGLTVGQGSLSDELLHYAGFRNAATLLGIRTYQRFPLESLLRVRPDLLIVQTQHRRYPSLAQELLRHPALVGTALRHEIQPSALMCATTSIADVAVALATTRQRLGRL